MIHNLIRVTSQNTANNQPNAQLSNGAMAAIPHDWLNILSSWGVGSFNGRIITFPPQEFSKSSWPFSPFQQETISLSWTKLGALTLGKFDSGEWITTGLKNERVLRIHENPDDLDGYVEHKTLESLLNSLNVETPIELGGFDQPNVSYFTSRLDCVIAAPREPLPDPTLVVTQINGLKPSRVFKCGYSLCHHFLEHEVLAVFGNFFCDQTGVQLSLVVNPDVVDPRNEFFSNLNKILNEV